MSDSGVMVATDRAAWLAERRTGIGGSDVAAILGLTARRTALTVWMDKLGRLPPQEVNEAMRFGTLLEPVVVSEFERRTGMEVRRGMPMQRSEEHPFMIANLDGLVEDRMAIVEAKTAGSDYGWGEPGTSEIPVYYVTQVAHYMAVTGADVAFVPVLIGGQDFRIYEVERDESLIADIIEAERAFWFDHVLADVAPEPVNREDALLLWARDNGTTVEVDEDVAQDVARLKAIKEEIRLLEERAGALDDRVRIAFRDAAAISHGGALLATYKAQTSKRLDVRAIEAEHPSIVAQFKRESSSRVLRLK
jgi:putative phage-type endonuclease